MSSYLQELGYDRSTPVVYRDELGRVPSSATLSVEHPDGTVLQSPTCTVSTTNTTIKSATTPTVSSLTLTSATGFAVGDRIAVTHDGATLVGDIAELSSGGVVTLLSAFTTAPSAGDKVELIKIAATVTAIGESYIGAGYRLRWELTGTSWTSQSVQAAAVCRWLWVEPANAKLVRDWIAGAFREPPSTQVAEAIAERSNNLVRMGLASMQRRPHLYPSAEVMKEAAIRAIALVAIDYQYRDRSDPNDAYNRRRAFDEQLALLRTSALDYDADDTGDTTPRRSWAMAARCIR